MSAIYLKTQLGLSRARLAFWLVKKQQEDLIWNNGSLSLPKSYSVQLLLCLKQFVHQAQDVELGFIVLSSHVLFVGKQVTPEIVELCKLKSSNELPFYHLEFIFLTVLCFNILGPILLLPGPILLLPRSILLLPRPILWGVAPTAVKLWLAGEQQDGILTT